ncbi:MAG: AMP-dependent synthetase/ligase [Myxococcales bacterium]
MANSSPASLKDVATDVPLPPVEPDIGGMIAARAARDPARTAVRFRDPAGKWTDLSWGELDYRRLRVAAGLRSLGVGPGDRVGFVSHNRAEMLVAELGVVTLGAIAVPVFPEYGGQTLSHCLRDSGARVAFCGTAAQQNRVAPLASIERIVVLDGNPIPPERALGLDELEALATPALLAEARAYKPAPDDVAYLLYTSGTTGQPKGVLLSHRNVLSQQAAVGAVWDATERDVFLGYLPWHHCFGALFERFMALHLRALYVIDDSRGRDLDRLLANYAEVKPTVYFSVPRVYQGLMARSLADPEVRKTVLHPGLRFVFTAAAPLSAQCDRFFRDAGIQVHEGWGLTETSPCVTLTRPKERRVPGVVGWPLPATVVRLAPHEASTSAAQGEVLVKGPQVMRGYHGHPEETARVLDADGFLRTGDLGEWTEHGLSIRGRVDGVFKLENGEKVSSATVEARILAATPLLEQAMALGPGQQHATALCWLSVPAAQAWAEHRGFEARTLEELIELGDLRLAIADAIRSANVLTPVSYERVRRIALTPLRLGIESGDLTPTLKIVRTAAQKRNAELIEALRTGARHPLVVEIGQSPDDVGSA